MKKIAYVCGKNEADVSHALQMAEGSDGRVQVLRKVTVARSLRGVIVVVDASVFYPKKLDWVRGLSLGIYNVLNHSPRKVLIACESCSEKEEILKSHHFMLRGIVDFIIKPFSFKQVEEHLKNSK